MLTFFNGKLARSQRLRAVEFIDAIPKVPCGDILRHELKERERVRREQARMSACSYRQACLSDWSHLSQIGPYHFEFSRQPGGFKLSGGRLKVPLC